MLNVVVFGDIEMGAGNLTDDFISDNTLAGIFLDLAKRRNAVDLVLNGDTFDFLKCPVQLQPRTIYPRHITKDISLEKLKLIYKAHKQVFDALKEFVAGKDKAVYFVVGNHDHDLVYKEVREELKRLLGGSSRVRFPGLVYKQHGVYVEHGHQYDILFQMNFEKLFLKHKGRSILNFPFITFGLISAFMREKEKYPFLERIFPRPALLTHHRVIAKELNFHTASYFLKSLLYYPFRFYSDPTYTFPTGLLRELFKRISTVHWDVDDVSTIFMRRDKWPRFGIYVLGHLHEKRIQKKRNKIIINPGSWRDEYDFQPKTRELIPRIKRYVDITNKNGELSYKLVDTYIERTVFDFDNVLKRERKHLELAAEEEGFSIKF
jgi:UDP-2,3-diacylglucosamine pyrophosphatase LpxH